MEYQHIRFEIREHVALITLNRPEVMNAFSGLMGEELSDAYQRCDQDDAIRVVIVTGAGKAFCAGADMTQGAQTFASVENTAFSACPLRFTPWEIRKPVIAAVNGHAVGLGLSLAMQADLRVFASEGKYGFLQVRRGVTADAFIHWTLPRLIGLEKAMDLLMTGRRIDGEEALRMGLASRCVPGNAVLDTALAWANEIAQHCSPLAVGLTKDLLKQSLTLSRDALGELETRHLIHTMGRPDALEGGMAYAEKRLPNWQSRVDADWPTEPQE
jgi:enoyl-CoA hydratase/carnithine racemase